MLDGAVVVLVLAGLLVAAWTGRMEDLSASMMQGAGAAVELTIELVGQLALWLGLVQILRSAGLVQSLASWLRPLMRRLFPEVPLSHPSAGAMILAISTNILGLGNAATPFGLQAMRALSTLGTPGRALAAPMVRFVVISCSGVAVIPTEMIALRAAAGATYPGAIILPSILATATSTIVGLMLASVLVEREHEVSVERVETPSLQADVEAERPRASRGRAALVIFVLAFAGLGLLAGPEAPSSLASGLRRLNDVWLLPFIVTAIIVTGFIYRVPCYTRFVEGAREGLGIALLVLPYLVVILAILAWFRGSGALEGIVALVGPWTEPLGLPAEAIPMALVRPLSGSGARGVAADAITAYGPDSFVATLTTVMNGSTETTFYVLALYFGAVRAAPPRTALIACLAADAAGVVASVFFTRALLF